MKKSHKQKTNGDAGDFEVMSEEVIKTIFVYHVAIVYLICLNKSHKPKYRHQLAFTLSVCVRVSSPNIILTVCELLHGI